MQVQIDQATGLFSNLWWSTVANDYSIMIFLVISLLVTVLNVLAKLNPSNKTDQILCLIQGWLYGFPGMKKQTVTEETKTETTIASTVQKTDIPPEEVKP
jgi:hypothetical protein